MSMIGKVRRMRFREGKSVREIARLTSLSRNTVRAWLREPEVKERRYRRPEASTQLTPYAEGLRQALAADALLLLAIFRMFSKDRYRRAHENQVYLEKTQKVRRAATEWVNRVKNSRKYHYYTCPKCKQRLRVPRGVGNITITCKQCGTKFDKKA